EPGKTVDTRRSRVSLSAVDSTLPPIMSSAPADGQFSLRGLVTDHYLVSVSGLPEDAYLKAAALGSADVLETSMNVDKQSSAQSLRVLISPDGGRINVGVLDRSNQPFPGAQVVLVPDAVRRQRPDQYRTAVADGNGQVSIRGIPPGDYLLF